MTQKSNDNSEISESSIVSDRNGSLKKSGTMP